MQSSPCGKSWLNLNTVTRSFECKTDVRPSKIRMAGKPDSVDSLCPPSPLPCPRGQDRQDRRPAAKWSWSCGISSTPPPLSRSVAPSARFPFRFLAIVRCRRCRHCRHCRRRRTGQSLIHSLAIPFPFLPSVTFSSIDPSLPPYLTFAHSDNCRLVPVLPTTIPRPL